jgi:hypothetical protein
MVCGSEGLYGGAEELLHQHHRSSSLFFNGEDESKDGLHCPIASVSFEAKATVTVLT